MLRTIRVLWLIATVGVLFAVFHFATLSTAFGARLAIEQALKQDLGRKWVEWVSYTTPTWTGQYYEATLRPELSHSDDRAPESWPDRARSWWDEPSFPRSGQRISVQYGQVFYGAPGGPVVTAFMLGPRSPSTPLIIAMAVLAFICILIAAIIGKKLEAEQAQKLSRRPGSILTTKSPPPPRR